jgi:hypothetical protein
MTKLEQSSVEGVMLNASKFTSFLDFGWSSTKGPLTELINVALMVIQVHYILLCGLACN